MIHSWNHHYDFSVANLGYTHEEASVYADVRMEDELRAARGPAESVGAGSGGRENPSAPFARPSSWLPGDEAA